MQTLHDFIKIADQFSINALIISLNVNFFSIFTNRIYSLTTYPTKLGHSVVKYANVSTCKFSLEFHSPQEAIIFSGHSTVSLFRINS